MKLSVNPGHWSSVDPGVMKLIRELGCASGTRAGGQAIDAAWWNTAELPAPQAPSRFAFERGYSSRSTEMVAWAFEDLLQLQMGLGAWKARGNTRPMSLCVVPFLFEVDGGLRWKMLRATEGELLIGNAPHFMQFWEGGALDDQVRRTTRARTRPSRRCSPTGSRQIQTPPPARQPWPRSSACTGSCGKRGSNAGRFSFRSAEPAGPQSTQVTPRGAAASRLPNTWCQSISRTVL